MDITAWSESIPLAKPFAISRGVRTHCDIVRVKICYRSHVALGECTPYLRYGESVESVLEQIQQEIPRLNTLPPKEAKTKLQGMSAGAARNALDCALWDLMANEDGLHFPSPYFDIRSKMETAITVSIDTPEKMARQAKEYVSQGATLLKVKLDNRQILPRVTAVRQAAPKSKIILDANEAWQNESLTTLFQALHTLNITMIEQPVPKGYDHMLKGIPHPIPLCADESCHTSDDLTKLEGCYEMINIKLDKSGGLTEAIALDQQARAKGFHIMVGCMLGTSLAMKAALPIATRADIVDLDGPVLLGTDILDCLKYQSGTLGLDKKIK
ncbi:L-Ala-D/L-Glu epimerase [Vibrio sp. Isolate25]|uniref:N-acetyl-D-Glu racemase DgcA n=1 Tax=Vibrio sp. Isolate25 TaxID=2908535 RepID=UPI001EFCA7AD|nr:N-acetyl-D-Glu racemase DgcA [Vibrio sp. Isolate25]MCG9595421.1 L-Ala-D/L-Glu epimerase [Vibrio sp. Isolate25]